MYNDNYQTKTTTAKLRSDFLTAAAVPAVIYFGAFVVVMIMGVI